MIVRLPTKYLSVLISLLGAQACNAAYRIDVVPTPTVPIPPGYSAIPVCVDINQSSQVACNLTVVETITPTPGDHKTPNPKLIGSYAYRWDSLTQELLLLSDPKPNVIDTATVINDYGFVGGSTHTSNQTAQGVIWQISGGKSTPTILGAGTITDLNNNSDYIFSGQLIRNGQTVTFPGQRIQVHALNNLGTAAGTQSLSNQPGQFGTGILYDTLPDLNLALPLFGYGSITAGVNVHELTDNGHYVISGSPGLLGGLKCHLTECQLYIPQVGSDTFGRATRYINLNAVNARGVAVGTDGGQAILINALGKRKFLDIVLPLHSGWNALIEAYGINDQRQIVGTGFFQNERAAFLMTKVPVL